MNGESNVGRILVTGGAGFVGSNLVGSLIDEGHQICIVDDLSSGRREAIHPDAKFILGDISNYSDVEEAFDFKPDYVLHLAALFANQNSVDHPERDLLVNGMGTLNILEFCNRKNVKKLVYTSSSCVYGDGELMEEDCTSFFPDTPYAVTKLLGERYCTFWATHHGLNVATVRLFNTYGPGELPGLYRNVIPNFVERALKNEMLMITGTGDETRDFTFVDDTVSGIKSVLFNASQPGSVFNVATGTQTSIREIASLINKYTANKAGIGYVPRRSWDHVTNRCGSVDKIRSEMGFVAKTSINEGIRQTCDWLRNNIH